MIPILFQFSGSWTRIVDWMPCFVSKLKRNILSVVVRFTILVLVRFFSFNWNFGDCRFEYKQSVMVYLLCRLTYPEMASVTSAGTSSPSKSARWLESEKRDWTSESLEWVVASFSLVLYVCALVVVSFLVSVLPVCALIAVTSSLVRVLRVCVSALARLQPRDSKSFSDMVFKSELRYV